MVALIIVAIASLVADPTPPTSVKKDRNAELVVKLADKNYRTREVAARELLLQGSAAIPALTEGMKNEDAEVSDRCRQLLVNGPALERRKKLEAFTRDPKSPLPTDLPGINRFMKMTGDTKESREIYAEMAAIHMETLAIGEKNPKEGGRLYGEFCLDAYNRLYGGNGFRVRSYNPDTMFNSRADIAYYLFASSDMRLRTDPNATSYAGILLNGNQIINAIDTKDGKAANAAMRKMFLNWLENENQQHMQQQIFQLAARTDMKEVLPIAIKLLDKKENNTYGKAQVMIVLGKLGNKEHMKKLEPYLSDSAQVTSVNFGDGRNLTVQMRDVALGVQIRLVGQKMADYGFDSRYGGDGLYPYYYGFGSDTERTEAHKKFQEWKTKNLKADPKTGPTIKTTPAAKQPEKK